MKRLALTLLIALLAGCGGSPEPQPGWVSPPTHPGGDGVPVSSGTAALTSLTLVRALATTDAEHPALTGYRAYVEAAQARGEQAGLFPNPQLMLRVENAPFYRGSTRDEANYVAGLSFQLPLSGRLGAAEEVGAREVDQRVQELAAQRMELHRKVRGAFATALSLERAAVVQGQARDLGAKAAELLKARVEAGDAIPADLARVQIEATRARLELERVESLRRRALVALATALGNPGLEIRSLAGDLERALELPSLNALILRLDRNPRLKAAQAEVALQEARLELAKARRVPDVSLDLFYRRLEQTNQHAFDVGVGIPLPVFNRNQGGVRAALAAQAASSALARATKNALVRDLRTAHARLAFSLRAVATLRDELLPRANTVLKSVEARFLAGDASLVEVLPVRRDWTRIQLGYINSLREVMVAWSDLQALTAAPKTP